MELINKNPVIKVLQGTEEIPNINDNSFYIIPSHWYIFSGLEYKYHNYHNAKNLYNLVQKTGNNNVLMMANSEEEEENLLKFFSIEQVIFCTRHFNHGLLDDGSRKFFPIDCEKEYDFIFNGGYEKNQEILQNIDDLCLINKRAQVPKVDCKYWNREKLTHEEVNKFINKSRVGLLITPIEGASWASMEYLMCGLPVISCKSKGGRDVFYNDNNSAIYNFGEPYKIGIEKYSIMLKEFCNENFSKLLKLDLIEIRKGVIQICEMHKNKLIDFIHNKMNLDKTYITKIIDNSSVFVK
jgi:glycosyltransferase involved in cell wall biosynthesis